MDPISAPSNLSTIGRDAASHPGRGLLRSRHRRREYFRREVPCRGSIRTGKQEVRPGNRAVSAACRRVPLTFRSILVEVSDVVGRFGHFKIHYVPPERITPAMVLRTIEIGRGLETAEAYLILWDAQRIIWRAIQTPAERVIDAPGNRPVSLEGPAGRPSLERQESPDVPRLRWQDSGDSAHLGSGAGGEMIDERNAPLATGRSHALSGVTAGVLRMSDREPVPRTRGGAQAGPRLTAATSGSP